MNALFADTFYLLALLNESDARHVRAEEAARRAREEHRELVTTAWVLTELGDALSAVGSKGSFLLMLDALRSDTMVTVLGPDSQHSEAGIELYRRRADKGWSVTDCISFAVMKERGITEALTGDRHFEQAGFAALLR